MRMVCSRRLTVHKHRRLRLCNAAIQCIQELRGLFSYYTPIYFDFGPSFQRVHDIISPILRSVRSSGAAPIDWVRRG
jgi:hypothetical protein